jgi:outer membrane immunogenic protein
MKKFGILAALLVAVVFGGPASAGPNNAPVFNWTGFYVGAHIGYGLGEDRFGGSASGAIGGIQLGHNTQFSNIVIGLEADLTGSDIIATSLFGTVRGRVGFTIDRVLIYATAGVMAADFENIFGNSTVLSGVVTGAGVEWMFAHHWSAKFEYLVADLEFGIELSTFKFGVNYRF